MPTSITYDVEIPIDPLSAPKPGEGGYVPFNPHSEVLSAGWKYDHPQAKPLDSPILVEHDVAIKMRDGITLYADVYRPPAPTGLVPAILCWSPFGKKFNGIMSLELMTAFNLGVKSGTLSGLEKFEAPDPAEWVPRGYAIVNIDIRGTGDSEGVMAILGSQEAEDGYDTIEALAKMPWCTGKVGMAGNSHLAIAQWFIAATQPPSLAAIAPWEGCGDLYREQFARGGIYAGDLFDRLIQKYMLHGHNGVESFRQMYQKSPLANKWWNDKRPDMKKIKIPTYITGTWTNSMHGMGAIRGYREVDTPQKWLRWHSTQEWYDIISGDAKEELLQFMDHFLQGKDNGWEKTPPVRMAVLRFGEPQEGKPQSYDNIVEEDFPIPRTEYKPMYFSSSGALSQSPPSESTVVSYNSQTAESVSFTHTFSETTRLVGIPKAVVYMSCPDYDDMDVYITLEKLSKTGEQMINLNVPWSGLPVKTFAEFSPRQSTEVMMYRGPNGILRASLRAIDESKSMHPNWPFYPLDKAEKITPGTIVKLEIGIWGLGIEYEAGEGIRVQVSGRTRAVDDMGTLDHIDNKGTHRVHIGGETPSHVILPFV